MVILADLERLEGRLLESRELAQRALTDPVLSNDRRLEADARWIRACVLATQTKTEEAETERTRALDIESTMAPGTGFPGVVAQAKYQVCAGNAAGAIAILREAVANGFQDPIVLHDPTFASLRERPDFAPIAAAVRPRARPGEPSR
jgi:ATP/maltotriose-dependent transcriptional regulator MalT